jgi:two-component system, chemotaxis family, sensor kinase Cph1
MSQVISRVQPRPPGAPGSTGAAGRRTRRGPSAGRRRGDRINSTALLVDEITTHEAVGTMLARRDHMVAVFAHDLRGLLNALTINAELFLRRDGEGAVETARNVRLTIGRVDQLIASLLDYVRVKANRLEVVPRPLNAAELLREAVEIFRPLARVKSLTLTLAIPDTPLRATADHDRIFQVVSNLLSNAIKFSSVKGSITVQATTSGDDLQIAVEDDGPGIPERDLDRVFEGFCQLQESDARGLGLGLYISRAIIEAHGGRIWATSRPGAGSTFSFTVPRSSSERAFARSPGGAARAAMA